VGEDSTPPTGAFHVHLPDAAEELSRRGITTASGKQWRAMSVRRARYRLGL
jgi:hypothetical protein